MDSAIGMLVRADRDSCISGGRCMATAPEIFDQDDDGLVVVVDARPAPEHQETARRAAFLCPAGAIRIDTAPMG